MGLFDGFAPQGFADRGGLLGRLLSLRPDLAQEQQAQPGQAQPTNAPGQQSNAASAPALFPSWPSVLGNAVGPSASGDTHPVQLAQAASVRIYSPDPLYVQPQFDPPPAYPPFVATNPVSPGGSSGAGALLGLGLGALILNNAKKTEEPSNEEETVGQPASRPPIGSLPIDQTPWSGDHTEIKGAIESKGPDHVRISPKGYVWGQNPDGSWTNHGPAGSFTGSGKPSGQRGKDRGRWR